MGWVWFWGGGEGEGVEVFVLVGEDGWVGECEGCEEFGGGGDGVGL